MAEVATRNAGGSVLHDVAKGASTAFDVRSWKGLTEILKAARASKMDEGEYATFRDTVLQYAQGGGSDAALRKNIEEIAAKFKVDLPQAPAESKVAEPERTNRQESSQPFMGTVRPAPRFGAPTVSVNAPQIAQSALKPTAAPIVETAERKISVPDNLPVATPAAKDVPEFIKRAPMSDAASVPIKKITPASAEDMRHTPEAKVSGAPERTRLPVREEHTQTDAPSGIKTVEEYKVRIAEIKRTVNAQVGNPITLMDGNNAIGREYMVALLGAMKAVSGTAPGTLQSSMDQLEKVFARVSQLPVKSETGNTQIKERIAATNIESKAVSVPKMESRPEPPREERKSIVPQATAKIDTPASRPVPTSERAQSSAPIASVRTPQMPARKESVPAQKPTPVATPKSEVFQRTTQHEVGRSTAPQPVSKPAPSSHAIPSLADTLQNAGVITVSKSTAPESQSKAESAASAVVPTVTTPVVLNPSQPSIRLQSSAPKTPAAAPAKTLPNVLKIGETSPVVSAMGKHAAKGVGRSGLDGTTIGNTDHPVPPGVKDDLHAPEVDEGLKQLLHEWSIFHGGGLFGTGPSGVEHPLYQKLAPLPMSIVGSGTWEGATKEAILSIRDYINGWRHEQGVSYIQTESFENYLRRVVKRVLKRIRG